MRKKPLWLSLRIWPLAAALVLAGMSLFVLQEDNSVIWLLGNLTFYSGSLFALTLLCPAFSVLGLAATLRYRNSGAAKTLRAYSLLCSCAACVVAAYLGYWGILGLRTWR